MKRRDVISLGGGLGLGAAWSAFAQTAGKVYRIGVLALENSPLRFLAALRELGYEEGRNVVFDVQIAAGQVGRLDALAAELVARNVDLIVCFSNSETLAAKRATATIPIVMLYAATPVEVGLVASLAHPGANVTGTTTHDPELAAKHLELVRDLLPRAARLAALVDLEYPGMRLYLPATERAAASLGIEMTILPCHTAEELDASLARIARNHPDALYVVPTGVVYQQRTRIIEFAARQRIPALYTGKLLVVEGGLVSYSQDFDAMFRRAAAIADRILKGARPGDIPVERPTKYDLAVNLKTARALGFKVPQSVLMRATEVIE